MSVEALTWAFRQDCPSPTAKLVLLGLANHANEHGLAAYPGNARLAEYAGCSVRHVRRMKRELAQAGLISRSEWQPVHIPVERRPDAYDLRGDILSSLGGPVGQGGGTSATGRGDPGVPLAVRSNRQKNGGTRFKDDDVPPQPPPFDPDEQPAHINVRQDELGRPYVTEP